MSLYLFIYFSLVFFDTTAFVLLVSVNLCSFLMDYQRNRYDSLSGQPSKQSSIAFEKSCILFNAAALCTQIASSRNLSKVKVNFVVS